LGRDPKEHHHAVRSHIEQIDERVTRITFDDPTSRARAFAGADGTLSRVNSKGRRHRAADRTTVPPHFEGER
jgi:hypothetical protein